MKLLCALAFSSAFFLSPLANAETDPLKMVLGGGADAAYLEPDGFYQAIIPGDFKCKQKGKGYLQCQGLRGPANFWIRVKDVPESATADLVALNAMEHFEKKDHFKELGRDSALFNKIPALMVRFQYSELGRISRPVIVQTLYTVQHGKLINVHFESRREVYSRYEKGLVGFFASFTPTPLDAGGRPIIRSLKKKKKRPTTDAEFLESRKKKDPFRTSY